MTSQTETSNCIQPPNQAADTRLTQYQKAGLSVFLKQSLLGEALSLDLAAGRPGGRLPERTQPSLTLETLGTTMGEKGGTQASTRHPERGWEESQTGFTHVTLSGWCLFLY